jgi:hypothetical protein
MKTQYFVEGYGSIATFKYIQKKYGGTLKITWLKNDGDKIKVRSKDMRNTGTSKNFT